MITRPHSETKNSRLVPICSKKQKWIFDALFLAWLGALAYFWIWWFQPQHILHTGWFIFLSILLL